MQRFESLRYEWHNYISEDIDELELIKEYLQNLTNPFGFLKHMVAEKTKELNEDDRKDM